MTALPTETKRDALAQPAASLGKCGARGFSLLELSLVLIVLGLLAGGLLNGLAAQQSTTRQQEAERQLDAAREALLAFAVVEGRLPCPAPANLPESDAAAGRENCSREHGVLPWVSLALPQTDPWGRRLSYFASSKFSATPAHGALAGFTLNTGLGADSTGLADVRSSTASAGRTRAIELAAVLLSHGAQGAGGYLASGTVLAGASDDQLENADQDLSFVAELPGPNFDDLVTWISPHLLKARLVAAGKLP